MDINPDNEAFYTTQYRDAFPKHVENHHCAKHQRVPVKEHESSSSSNIITSATASESKHSCFDSYDWSCNDEEYLQPNNVAERTPGQSDRAADLLTAAGLYLNSPPEAPNNWWRINPNFNDDHSDPTEIISTYWYLDITYWWRQQEQRHWKYTKLLKVPWDAFSIIPLSVGGEARFSLGRGGISWRPSKTTGKTIGAKIVVRMLTWANNGIVAGNNPEMNTKNTANDLEMNKVAKKRKFHRMAEVHDFLVMWQGSQILRATQRQCGAQNKQMTAVGYISDTEEIVTLSWSLFQHNGAAPFILKEWSPLPPRLSEKNLPLGWTPILNVRQIRKTNCQAVKSNEDSAHQGISDTEDWLHWNWDLDDPIDCKDDCAAEHESDIEQENGNKDPECPKQRGVSDAPNDRGFIWPIRKSKRRPDNVSTTVAAIEMRRNKIVKNT